MSFILEALRKSERDRQLACGPMASVLCPAPVETTGRAWSKYLVLAAAGIAVFIVALFWWSGSKQPSQNPLVFSGVSSPVASSPVAPSPVASSPVASSLVAVAKPAVGDALPAATVQVPSNTPNQKPKNYEPARSSRVATTAKSDASAWLKSAPPVPGNVGKWEEAGAGKAPIELPVMIIAGYIRDEQGGSLAMINEKLVREGEEVAPGLRLEKILGDMSIFNYRGYRFQR